MDNLPPDVTVTLKSKCGRRRGEDAETDRCLKVELGTSVEFAAEVRARRCLEEGAGFNFTISPVGIRQELVVEVDTICDCDCEGPGSLNSYAWGKTVLASVVASTACYCCCCCCCYHYHYFCCCCYHYHYCCCCCCFC